MEEIKNKITQKDLSKPLEEKKLSNEELLEYIDEWKKGLTPEDIKSIINQIEDPITKLIAQKLLALQDV